MAALRPLDEAAEETRRLDEYASTDELATAIPAVMDALERSLRLWLRSDLTAPDDHRLTALSPDLDLDDVLRSLRARDVLSLEAAGIIHEARSAAARVESTGTARPADADPVREAVERVRQEVEGADATGASAGGDEAREAEEREEPRGEEKLTPHRRAALSADTGRWMAWLAAAIAAFVVLAAAWVVLRGGSEELDQATTAFRAGRMDSAAAMFGRVLEDRPADVSVMLYLARSYRRLDRPADAADVLRRAADLEPDDPDVRRELGHLFMDLGQLRSAVGQYERALEHGPGDPLNWAALIRALREMEDPRAEQLLRDAPAEVRAALGVDTGPS